MTGGHNGGICFQVSLEGVSRLSPEPPPDNIRIYNNTAFKSDMRGKSPEFNVVKIDNYAMNVTVQNNLGYAVASTLSWTPLMISGTGASGLIQSNNSTSSQIKNIFPKWVNATPTIPADFSLTANSYAREAGITTPVWSDFFLNSRPQSSVSGVIDMGAIEGR